MRAGAEAPALTAYAFGNVLTLSPFGLLLPFAAPGLATWRRMAAAAVLFPLAIELSQLSISVVLGSSYRVAELDDVLLDFVGVLLGHAVFAALRARSMMTLVDTGPRQAPSPRPRGRRP